MAARTRGSGPLLALYLLLSVVHLAATATSVTWLQAGTKPLLMLVLAGYTLTRSPGADRRATTLLVAGLVFSAAGDTALLLPGTAAFLAGMAAFGLTHVCYLLGYLRLGAAARLRHRWWIAGCYTLAWIGLLTTLIHSGKVGTGLLIAQAGYGALLLSMATLAGVRDGRMGLGALLFAASDTLIGLRSARILVFGGQEFAIMLLYLVGQLAIVLRYTSLAQIDAPVPGTVPAA